ncbi:alkaline phosphatase family protein [Candidatus Acetothermia bacterium]|nr:alkaline phosphatase family protein [Candidatus Acetothermia bacterium]MBI3459800.1 alkaline phosphatase family protein [Candidatus Acetothermia bacterium]
MKKILVIALDGATMDLIGPWAQEGKLPNLARLMTEGAYGRMKSTIPPITGAAWSTFQTGVNPGKHGVFDWLARKRDSYQLAPISSRSIDRPLLWEYLSAHGKRVGVIGVPVSYPARPVNGFMLTDLLTPAEENYAYPPTLKAEIEANVGRYPVMPDHWRGRHAAERWVAGLKESLAQRVKTALYLMEHQPWDFLMVHFMETDSVQHQMWHLLDGEKREVYRTYGVTGNPILAIYQQADQAVGQFIANSPDATVFVISDHGFGPLRYNIHLNCWLLHHGYLRLKKNPATLLKRLSYTLGLTAYNISYIAEESRLLERGAQLKHIEVHELFGRYFLSMQNIDWSQTRAYSHGNVGQVFLNLKGREPEGVVEPSEAARLTQEIAEGLRSLSNPMNGEKVLSNVYHRETVYKGSKIDQAAELILASAEKYMAIGTSEFLANREVTPAYAGSGWHRPEGIFIASGESIRPGTIPTLHIVDMFPTILFSMGISLPPDLDGQVPTPIFTEEFLDGQSELLSSGENLRLQKTAHSKSESKNYDKEIRNRLRGMGYI